LIAGGSAVVGGAVGAISAAVASAETSTTTFMVRPTPLQKVHFRTAVKANASAHNVTVASEDTHKTDGSLASASPQHFDTHHAVIGGISLVVLAAACGLFLLCVSKLMPKKKNGGRSERMISTERLSRLPQEESEPEDLVAQPEPGGYARGSAQDPIPRMPLPEHVERSMSLSLGPPPMAHSFQASSMQDVSFMAASGMDASFEGRGSFGYQDVPQWGVATDFAQSPVTYSVGMVMPEVIVPEFYYPSDYPSGVAAGGTPMRESPLLRLHRQNKEQNSRTETVLPVVREGLP